MSKNPSNPDFFSFIPFKKQLNRNLNQQTIDIFWEMKEEGVLPDIVMEAVVKKKELAEDLRTYRS